MYPFGKRLIYEAFYSLSAANGYIRAAALGLPTIPVFLAASARDYPNIIRQFHRLATSVRFRTGHNLYSKSEYRYEGYGKTYIQADPVVSNMTFPDSGAGTSIYPGSNDPGYNVHVLAFAMEYRF